MVPRLSAEHAHRVLRIHAQHGSGIFGDAWNWIKRNKIISKGIGALVPGTLGKVGSTVTGMLGVGDKATLAHIARLHMQHMAGKSSTAKRSTAKRATMTGGRKKSTRKKSTRKKSTMTGGRKKSTRKKSTRKKTQRGGGKKKATSKRSRSVLNI